MVMGIETMIEIERILRDTMLKGITTTAQRNAIMSAVLFLNDYGEQSLLIGQAGSTSFAGQYGCKAMQTISLFCQE